MMNLIDTHSHIDLPDFDDVDLIIKNARDSGVERIVIPSVDATSFNKIIQLTADYPEVFGALGIHPSEAKEAKESDFEKIEKLCENEKIVAIGECGLDYYWDKSFVAQQKEVFQKQIDLAIKYKKALIVHDREAHKDTFDMLKGVKEIPVVMHCFSGSVEFAHECIREGFYIALGGVVTFKNAKKANEVAKETPLSHLLLETDAPYLTPEPFRGKRNEPAYLKYVVERIAQIRDCSVEDVAQATTSNARKVFGF